jgi:hypothetical protein
LYSIFNEKFTQFNNSCTTSLTIKKPTQGTLDHWGLFNGTKITFPFPLKIKKLFLIEFSEIKFPSKFNDSCNAGLKFKPVLGEYEKMIKNKVVFQVESLMVWLRVVPSLNLVHWFSLNWLRTGHLKLCALKK